MSTNEEIIAQHRVQHKSVDCVVFEPEKATRLVANFTGMQLGNFNRWSWFHQRFLTNDNTIYISFKDDEHLFYLDRASATVASDHIEFVKMKMETHGLSNKDLYFIGSSMGAYAAIYFAFALDAKKAVASVPQVDFESAKLIHPWTLWNRKMNELGEHWIDLDKHIRQSSGNPEILLLHGTHPADSSAAENLVRALEERNIVFDRIKFDTEDHKDFLSQEYYDELFTTS